jgi:hypothetical protein
MPLIIENKLIILNSSYATQLNGTLKSNVIFNFTGILRDEEDIVSSNICIMNAQIPVSFYTINANNNIIGTNKGNVVIPIGNYNFNSLAPVVVSAFSTQISVGITLTISKFTGLITFTFVSGIANTYYNFNNSYKIFGFLPNVNYPYVGSSVISPFPLNLLGVKKINIRSPELQISSFSSISNNLSITLATLPVDVPAFSMISYINQTDLNKTNLRIKIIDQISISLTDEDNTLLDFNGLDWNISLVLENVRLIADKAPSFRELMEKRLAVSSQPIEEGGSEPLGSELNEEPINDIKDLEFLNN